jgi:glycosyltransferase involved in cell wall biosynthesis
MAINVTITCDLSKPNPREFVKCLSLHEKINLSILSNSSEHPSLEGINNEQIEYYSPPYSPTLYPFIPTAKRQLGGIIEGFDTEILLSMGVGPLVFTGLATNFSPTILIPQGAETAMAVGPYYFTDKTWYKMVAKYIYRPMFIRLLDHVTEIWGIADGNKSIYTNLGMDKNKFRAFDWVPVDTNQYTPTGETIPFDTDPDDVIIATFRRLRGELVLDSCFPFLDAIETLSERRDDFHVIFGSFYDGESKVNKEVGKKLMNMNGRHNITKQKLIPKEEMPTYYRSVDIFFNLTFPGNPQGALGTGPKEAMASGSTLVTPNNSSSGPAEYVIDHRKNGVLTSLDSNSIAEELEYLLKNEQKRKDIAKNGLNMVRENFSNEKISEYAYEYMAKLVE